MSIIMSEVNLMMSGLLSLAGFLYQDLTSTSATAAKDKNVRFLLLWEGFKVHAGACCVPDNIN